MIVRIVAILMSMSIVLPLQAGWLLDNGNSTLKFVSTKKNAISEVHYFNTMTGTISDDGKATIIINLASVETNIPIRNERMQTMLFNVADHANATISTIINMSELDNSDVGGVYSTTNDVTVDLFGKQKTYSAKLTVMKLGDDKIGVVSTDPIIVEAADFGLEGGIEALREVAGLPSIATSVPVTFILVYNET
ncbi:YceI family protein [Vibrio hangzhouensis]|uniref:YceI-like domain-containing protein n=1 Tax=Vibrio hangzhouensis TaxID=462991 RepID=A0A1H5V482_9VIBR|nr:YceI family protein [Vibrio hangzhouensis]SEF82185.1 YceI-like domain-containing protein [Vibrio hangzhouensis]